MKKSVGWMVAAGLTLGMLAVSSPAAADETKTIEGVVVSVQDGGSIDSYVDDFGSTIIDVDFGDGQGYTYNVDTEEILDWQKDENGDWQIMGPPEPNEPDEEE